MTLNERYELGPVVAVQWNNELADRFPNADHTGCRQSLRHITELGVWEPFTPALCHDYHCPNCGNPCNYTGHRQCTT